jgi:putative membrane protein
MYTMVKISKAEKLDVDVRFLLSNERTLLAWIRTALTIQAGGIALSAFHPKTPWMGVVILFLGMLVALIGYRRYQVADQSIREGHLPPAGTSEALQVYGLSILAVILAIFQVVLFT